MEFIKSENPWLKERIEEVDNLDEIDKARLYMDYYLVQIFLKHNFVIVQKGEPNWSRNYRKRCNNIYLYYLWEDIEIQSKEEFFSKDQIFVRDFGEKWEDEGKASRYWFVYNGAYSWYGKVKEKLFYEREDK